MHNISAPRCILGLDDSVIHHTFGVVMFWRFCLASNDDGFSLHMSKKTCMLDALLRA
jgi:hypothetical protein